MADRANPYQSGYPFSAIVGQERLKLALLLNAVNPAVGGVLIRGEKGTAKSTAVRGLASLLPEITVAEGCPFNLSPEEPHQRCELCRAAGGDVRSRRIPVPLINLPLNATEDRVGGGIDFSWAVTRGERRLAPGLLAAANRGILYVDEVNLLDEHIVDMILDAATTGVNIVEREGLTCRHPSRFILVGTMNPEEGELRPQLLDRFGLCVEVSAERDIARRITLMRCREEFDNSPGSFVKVFEEEERKLSLRIRTAAGFLPRVEFPEQLRPLAAELSSRANVAGHRADLFMEQAARALAALEGRTTATVEDLREISSMVLAHRKRDAEPPPPEKDAEEDTRDREERNGRDDPENPHRDEPDPGPGDAEASGKGDDPAEAGPEEGPHPGAETERPEEQVPGGLEQVFEVGETFRVKSLHSSGDRMMRRGAGRRSRSRTAGKIGRYVKSTPDRGTGDIAFDATLRAAAPYQLERKREGEPAIVLRREDIREKVREKKIGNFLLFLVDASGSMGARKRMTASKGAVMSLLLDAYQKRDRVAMITFRKDAAVVNLPPTSSIDLAARLLEEMTVGGRTPLSAGLIKAGEMLRNHLVREPESRPIVFLITDGRANMPLSEDLPPMEEAEDLAAKLGRDGRVRFVVVDTERQGLVRFGLASRIAAALNAQYFKIEDLKAETLLDIAKENAV